MTRPVAVVLAVRTRLSRWQAARYRVQSAMAGPFRRLSLGLAGVLAVGAVLALSGALMVMLGLVP
jgi:hypothetical protein